MNFNLFDLFNIILTIFLKRANIKKEEKKKKK